MLIPLIRTLQAAFPAAKLTWIISQPAYSMIEGLDGVEFIVIDKPRGIGDYWRFAQKMRGRKFDVLLATQASFRANLLYPLIRARRKIGYDPLRAKDGHGWFVSERITPGQDHTLESFLKFAEALGVMQKKISWDIPIPDADVHWARAQLPDQKRPLVLVNPAASKAERSWPVERYIEVIQYLQKRWQAQVILTGGPGSLDQKFASAILEAVSATNLIGKTKPKQLLALIRHADLLLCPDTGPSHMAAAVGTSVIALHAVTSSRVSGPYTSLDLAVDYYPQAVQAILKTTEAKNAWGTHAHGLDTMELIPVFAVIEKLEQVLLAKGFKAF
ncbi:heptosyl transferase, glycosyltransferase family 9 protein [Legionella londiniensis]|uniref:Heptosyl transferase, glycosyltransferase family 9 protein n=2 Tax=Legionella londiniensis TaxID=45068 RepID=A0A0W0VHP9_9GAMM|nr:heptosyl transferase, glycosyltransferase family 9 protein [Legionella londiniensis]STX92418.1 heptosyl transferase, glycosyltransferase family 9 protein [Legionella londiniensis]